MIIALAQVDVEVFWLPFPDQRGRLIATRRTLSSGGMVTEFWISKLVDAVELVGITMVRSTYEWTRLLRNENVPVLPGPVPLTECPPGSPVLADIEQRLRRHGDDDNVLQALAGATVRLTLPVTVAYDQADAGIHAQCVDVTHKPDDVLALPFGAALRAAVYPLHLHHEAASSEMVTSASTNDASIADSISFERVRGAQVGYYNIQFNTFIAEYKAGDFTFDDVIRQASVIRAVRQLQDEPGNGDLRRELIATLRSTGWHVFEAPQCMTVGRQHRGLIDVLEGLLGFDVRGLQTGSGNRQRNTFVYEITRTPAAADLLGCDRALATALADVLCPPPDSGRDLRTLRDTLGRHLEALPIEWADGVTRGASYALGTVSLLRDHDGVSVGSSTVINEERVDAVTPGVTLEALTRQPYTSQRAPTAAPPDVQRVYDRTIERSDERYNGISL